MPCPSYLHSGGVTLWNFCSIVKILFSLNNLPPASVDGFRTKIKQISGHNKWNKHVWITLKVKKFMRPPPSPNKNGFLTSIWQIFKIYEHDPDWDKRCTIVTKCAKLTKRVGVIQRSKIERKCLRWTNKVQDWDNFRQKVQDWHKMCKIDIKGAILTKKCKINKNWKIETKGARLTSNVQD